MKKTYFTIFLLMTTVIFFGQDRFQERMNNLRAQKIAFITQRMNLTPDEAQVFWPIYNELSQKKDALNKRRKEITFELKNNRDNYSDAEKEELADEYINLKLKDANLDLEYYEKFKKVLSIEKVLRLFQAELAFKGYLLNKIKHQNAKGGQHPPRQRFE
jgi:hypothetical protein